MPRHAVGEADPLVLAVCCWQQTHPVPPFPPECLGQAYTPPGPAAAEPAGTVRRGAAGKRPGSGGDRRPPRLSRYPRVHPGATSRCPKRMRERFLS